jgi:hypothetical protein
MSKLIATFLSLVVIQRLLMACGCNGGGGGAAAAMSSQQVQTIVRRDLSPLSKKVSDHIATEDLVKVRFALRGPVQDVFGLATNIRWGSFQFGDEFLMAKVDYERAISMEKLYYDLIGYGFNPEGLPGVGEKIAQKLRYDFGVVTKQDLLNLGVEGLQKVHQTITEEKAQEIIDAVNAVPSKS